MTKYIALPLCLILLSCFVLLHTPKQAYAGCMPPQCGCCAGIISECQNACICTSSEERGSSDDPLTTIGHITDEFNKHRTWIVEKFFKDGTAGDKPGLLAAMKLMTEQLTVNAIQQTQAIGQFFDAKHQLETQRLFQVMVARAHKDYHPDEQLCEFGTFTRSLASSARNNDLTAMAFSRHSVDRQLLSKDTVGNRGIVSDQQSRLVQFIKKYCNPEDNIGNLDLLCMKGGTTPELFNRDISFTQTIDAPLTLDIDFSNDGGAKTDDEEAVFALSANLYSHRILPEVVESKLVTEDGKPTYDGVALGLMDARALTAKRSVAANNLVAITALKTKGDPEVRPFIYSLIEEMGKIEGADNTIELEEIQTLLGEQPSYYAQMEILTKKFYQMPHFYSDLYDKPANVARKDVALQAATLMQKRDLYHSFLRSEMTLAVMLEAALMKEQGRVTNEVNAARQRQRTRRF